MTKLSRWEKLLYGIAILIIVVFTGLGFYLIEGEPAIESLVASGHNHILSFAYGAILFGMLLGRTAINDMSKWWLSVWMSLTYLGPLALIYAGFTGQTGHLSVTSPLFMGSFVVLWALLLLQLMKS